MAQTGSHHQQGKGVRNLFHRGRSLESLPPVSPKRFDPGLLQVFSEPFDSVHDSLGNTLIKPRQVTFSLRSKFDRVFHRLPPKAEFFGDLGSRNTFLSLSFRLKRTS